MVQRNESLDALRGWSILAMILSGSIAYGNILPAWMFHAQVPPPEHTFNPAIPGITWVDLVFPFFLFSMGAAIPLSMKKLLEAGKGPGHVLPAAFKRFLLLAFFALFSQHMKAWVISPEPGNKEHWLSILAFGLMFLQFYEYKGVSYRILFRLVQALAFLAGSLLLWLLPFRGGRGFDWYGSDIIIMVLANMAFFGTLVYFLTARNPALRLALLPFVMAVFLAARETGDGWAKTLFSFNHIGPVKIDWLYKFYFLKYLFIILPGTLAGDWMLDAGRKSVMDQRNTAVGGARQENLLAGMGLLLVLLNLYGLFTRQLFFNLAGSAIVCFSGLWLSRELHREDLYRRYWIAGTYLLLLGLFFEAYEGGIRKDPSTYSYYFVTGGLAFFSLVVFTVMGKRKYMMPIARLLALNGRNPMVAYVAGNLLILPILGLTGLKDAWDGMRQDAFMGLMKGVLFTAAVSAVTIIFSKRKWFWKS